MKNKKHIIRTFLIVGTFLFLFVQQGMAQQEYLGIWRAGNDSYALYRFNSWEEFTAKWKEVAAKNQRLVDVEVVKNGNALQYTGVWRSGQDGYALNQFTNWNDFVAKWKELGAKNLRLVDLEIFKSGDKMVYLGVWCEGKDAYALNQLHSWNDFVAKWKELAAKNLRLVDVEAIAVGNNVHYTGVWRAGKEGPLYSTKNWNDFVAKWKELAGQNQRLVDVKMLAVDGDVHYIGIWNSGDDGYALFKTDDWEAFVDKYKELNEKNLRLVKMSVISDGSPVQAGKGKPIPPQETPKGKPLGLVFNNQPTKKDAVSGLDFPVDMPPINYPDFDGCNAEDKKKVMEAWAYSHFCMWRAYQVINYIADSRYKGELWNWGYDASLKDANWSPRAWFGEFKDSRLRFQLMHEAINKAWNERFLGKKISFKAKCREGGNGGEHPCYIKDKDGNYKYAANHIVLGTINFCPVFLDKPLIRDRARTLIHEVFHWLSAKGLYVSDTHTHSDKDGGICKTKTEKLYGMNDALHVASSDGCWGNDTLHREMAVRNNDNYAYFIQRLGNAIYEGKLTRFPDANFFQSH